MNSRSCFHLRATLVLVFGLSFGLWFAPAFSQPAVNASAPTQPVRIKPASGIWDSGAGFRFDLGKKKLLKTRQSVSGIACNLNAQQRRVCLVAFDEGTEARYAVATDGAFTASAEPIALRVSGDKDDGELDAEGAASDGLYFYVTGSHSAKRNDCSSNPGSRHVIRFRLDPATGRALRSPEGALVDLADTGRLWDVMRAQPALQAHVGERQCLGSEPPPEGRKKARKKDSSLVGQQGVNIEGLAVRDGRLYFGFRGPALNSVALVLSVDADALFSGSDAKAQLTPMALGPHRGIRDMVAVSNGLLLLAGPDDSPANQGVGWTVSWWDGKPAPGSTAVVQPKLLAALDLSTVALRACDAELKPEAITVLAETPQAYELLVLSDGLCDGGPMRFTVPR